MKLRIIGEIVAAGHEAGAVNDQELVVHTSAFELDEADVDTVFDQPFIEGVGLPGNVLVQDQADLNAPFHGIDQGIAQIL